MVESCPKDSPGQQTLLEAAKAMASLKGWSEAFIEMRNLRAAIAREEAKPATDAQVDYQAGRAAWWQIKASEANDRAQQAEASAAWHRSESERLSIALAALREEHAKFREQVEDGSYARAIRQELQATQMIGTLDAARSLRQRAEKAEAELAQARQSLSDVRRVLGAADGELTWMAAEKRVNMHQAAVGGCETLRAECRQWRDRAEKAEAECREQRARAESGEDRNRELSEKLIAAHGKTHAESERVKKAEAELAAVHEALKACLRPETQTGSARGDANVIAMVLQETCSHILRAGYSTPLTVREAMPQVVDELLRLRGEAESAKPQQPHPMDGGDITVMLNRAGVKAWRDAFVNMTTPERVEWLIGDWRKAEAEAVLWKARADEAETAVASHCGALPAFEGDPKACAFIGIVRDPVTGWTFGTMRQQFDAARTTVRVLAAELVAARQQIAVTKGFEA